MTTAQGYRSEVFDDLIWKRFRGTPQDVQYDQALDALADYMRGDPVGWKLLDDYESAVLQRVIAETAIVLELAHGALDGLVRGFAEVLQQ